LVKTGVVLRPRLPSHRVASHASHRFGRSRRAYRAQGLEELIGPSPYSRSSTPQELFTEAQWDAECARDPGLRMERMWGLGGNAGRVEAAIQARWAALDEDGRRRCADAAAAASAFNAAYNASIIVEGGNHPPLLNALLQRCAGVHTLTLNSTASAAARLAPRSGGVRLSPADPLLARICASWGVSLRILHLGCARLTADDVHSLLRGCPQLVQLGAGQTRLDAAADTKTQLFDARLAGVHPQMRSLALPALSRAQGGLAALVGRARATFPSLRELNAEAYGSDVDAVTQGARAAHQLGVRRFVCPSFFDGRYDSDGGFGSDGGSCGEYCGDGDVIKYMFGR